MSFDSTNAQRAGLRTRALAETIDDTAAWLVLRDNGNAWRNTIDGAIESAILDSVDRR
jgi:hypothetical protein